MIEPTKPTRILLACILFLLCLPLAAAAQEASATMPSDDGGDRGKARSSTNVTDAADHREPAPAATHAGDAAGQEDNGGLGITPFPVIYYTPETSLALGGGVVFTLRGEATAETSRPDNLQLMTAYTLNNQFFLTLAPEKYFDDGRAKLFMNVGYLNWPTSFFGVGNGSNLDPDAIEDLEETYTDASFMVQPWLSRKVVGDFSVGLTLDWKDTRILDVEPGGLLDQGDLTGAGGGIRSGLGPVFAWDTRDNLFAPSKGSWHKAWAWFYREWLGSDFDYDCYALDLRHYRPIPGDGVLALQGFAALTSGEVPFNEYPTPMMRGLYENVFTDKNAAALRAEYRFPIDLIPGGRWGGAVFGAVGDTFPDAGTMEAFDPKVAGGAGLRFALNKQEKINVRLDIGVSRYGVFPYIMLQEAF